MSTEQRNVVFIGFGIGASGAAAAIRDTLPSTHRLVIISATEVGYATFGAVRAMVVAGWEDRVTVPMDGFFPKDSRHVLLSGTKVVKLEKNQVTVDREHSDKGFGTIIPFEYAVVATGSHYAAPWYPAEGTPIDAVRAQLKSYQTDVASATSFLVVGGGPVGVETAGEIKAAYPNTAVTLVTGAKSLVAAPGVTEKFQRSALTQLEQRGIEVIFGEKVDVKGKSTGKIEKTAFTLSNGKVINADYLVVATGGRPNSDIVRDLNPDLIDGPSNQIKVKPTLQLDSGDKTLDHIFALGDVAHTNDLNTFVSAKSHGPVVAHNLSKIIASRSAPKSIAPQLKSYVSGSLIMMMSVGPKGGVGIMFGWNVPTFLPRLAKSGSLFTQLVKPAYGAK